MRRLRLTRRSSIALFRRGGTLRHGRLGLDGAAVASPGPGLKVTGCTFEDVVRGVEVEASYNTQPIGPVLIANNLMRNPWSAGVIVIPGNHRYLNDIIIANNIITGDRQVRPGAEYQIGIRVHGGSRVMVTGNNVGQCASDGINLVALAPLVDISVANNTCWENGGRNIAVVSRFNQVRNAMIAGNLCLRNGEIASIEVSGDSIAVTDNTLIESAGSAIRATADTGFASQDIVIARNRIGQTAGDAIVIDPGVRQTVIRDNHSDAPTATLDDQGSNTQKDQAFLDRSRSYQPSALQTVAANDQIRLDAYNLRVAGLGGPVTLLTTPTIPAGRDGQILCILGTSNQRTITLRNQTSTRNTGLGLAESSRKLGRGDILTLRYDEADAIWWEVSFSNK